ncbi:MAG: hypothetical protein QM770_14470 [Tepidisphaeraceae bacterium]
MPLAVGLARLREHRTRIISSSQFAMMHNNTPPRSGPDIESSAFTPRFELGTCFVSLLAAELAGSTEVLKYFLFRHEVGDWGDVSEARGVANGAAIDHGGPIESEYLSHRHVRYRIVTAVDRKSTVIYLPHEQWPPL